ncbi:MAG: hypothetical protein QM777_07325 [Pseudorhodoferax sp.]
MRSSPHKRLIGGASTGTGGSDESIAKSALLRIPVRYPEVSGQEAISKVLFDMGAEITSLANACTLKQAMAQALLTGRICLPVGKSV